jgi:hypothetical protein
MVAISARRVSDQTSEQVNQQIDEEMHRRFVYFEQHPEQINQRLRELDAEWDIERALETGSSALTLAGLLLGVGVSRKWLLLSLAVQGFFMQHALQGWCPPLPVFRRLGFRTQYEIEQERCALKAMRADLRSMAGG